MTMETSVECVEVLDIRAQSVNFELSVSRTNLAAIDDLRVRSMELIRSIEFLWSKRCWISVNTNLRKYLILSRGEPLFTPIRKIDKNLNFQVFVYDVQFKNSYGIMRCCAIYHERSHLVLTCQGSSITFQNRNIRDLENPTLTDNFLFWMDEIDSAYKFTAMQIPSIILVAENDRLSCQQFDLIDEELKKGLFFLKFNPLRIIGDNDQRNSVLARTRIRARTREVWKGVKSCLVCTKIQPSN